MLRETALPADVALRADAMKAWQGARQVVLRSQADPAVLQPAVHALLLQRELRRRDLHVAAADEAHGPPFAALRLGGDLKRTASG